MQNYLPNFLPVFLLVSGSLEWNGLAGKKKKMGAGMDEWCQYLPFSGMNYGEGDQKYMGSVCVFVVQVQPASFHVHLPE